MTKQWGITRLSTAARAVLVTLAIAGGSLVAATSASAAGQTVHGCPYGSFCVYPQGIPKHLWSAPEPGGILTTYGPHNLSGQYGLHIVYNNQWGGAGASYCLGYNGTGGLTKGAVPLVYQRGWSAVILSPVNSITLWLPRQSYRSTALCQL